MTAAGLTDFDFLTSGWFWSNAIASGALVLSVIALVKSNKATSTANHLQKEVVDIEKRKEQTERELSLQAALRVALVRTPERNLRFLIGNDGRAEARNIRCDINGNPLGERKDLTTVGPLPNQVGAGGTIGCVFLLFGDYLQPPYQVVLTWDDDFGKDRTYKTNLTIEG